MPPGHFMLAQGDEPTARVDITITRADLAEAACAVVPSVPRREARAIVDLLFEEIANELAQGAAVKLHTFGTFVIRSKRERMGRNPRTGVSVAIEPRRVIAFKASPQMRDAIAQGYAHVLEPQAPPFVAEPEPFPADKVQAKTQASTKTTTKAASKRKMALSGTDKP